MLRKYQTIALFLTMLFILLNSVSAQDNAEDIQTNLVNEIIVPTVVLFVLVFGILSTLRIFPKTISGLLAGVFAGFLFYTKKITLLTSIVSSFGDVVSTFVFIGLFILGIFLISKGNVTKGSKKSYYKAKTMKRKQITEEISKLEKSIAKIDSDIIKLKSREDDLETKFAVSKDKKIQKELDRLRKRINYFVDTRDRLLEKKDMYKRAHREATT